MPEEWQGEDHHGGHEVDQVIQAEGQHQPEVSAVVAESVDSASPVKYMISLVHEYDQGQAVPYHADGGHCEQHQTLHHILKCHRHNDLKMTIYQLGLSCRLPANCPQKQSGQCIKYSTEKSLRALLYNSMSKC